MTAAGGSESERLRILELLEQQKITATEAADLLAAISERGQSSLQQDRGRWFRVRVTDQRSGRLRTNVSVPISMAGFGLGFARRLRNVPGLESVDDLFEAIRSGRRGVIFDVSSENGERVEILID
ncbi:MAG: hypothetical protein JOZ81_34795 [Chloroflexi bacterium]|nr:hypothetical protein [Chloroflexota bacterium]MBV9544142.1 hypothetical protein [Chloroflexota bacterium]